MKRIWPLRRRRNGDTLPAFDPAARPDFFCVGAQRSGTSWLYEQLNSHPDFWMPPLKELHYFDEISRNRHPDRSGWGKLRMRDERDRQFIQAFEKLCDVQQISLELYAQLFAAKGTLLSGDITPAYSTLPEEVIAAVAKQFPELKVLFLARDPVERAWSNLSRAVWRGGIPPFDASDPRQVLRNVLHPEIIIRSYPSMIAERWRRHFECFRIYFFDDLESDPVGTQRSIIGFLGADPEKCGSRVKADRKINEVQNRLPLTDGVRSQLARFFEHELRACAAKLGGAAKKWPARYGFVSVLWLAQLACDCDCFLWDVFVWC